MEIAVLRQQNKLRTGKLTTEYWFFDILICTIGQLDSLVFCH